MPMFDESCIVRHTDIRETLLKGRGRKMVAKPNATKLRCRVRLPAIRWPNRPIGANLVQTMDPR
jgi:hypothetical protein